MQPRPSSYLPPRGAPPPSAQQRILAQWRGWDLFPVEKAAQSSARAAGSLLPGVLKTLRLEQRRAEAEIVKVWNHLLDPVLTAHAQPTGLHKGTLFVAVDNSAWLSEIVRYRRKEILDRLQHSFGPALIARISFRLG